MTVFAVLALCMVNIYRRLYGFLQDVATLINGCDATSLSHSLRLSLSLYCTYSCKPSTMTTGAEENACLMWQRCHSQLLSISLVAATRYSELVPQPFIFRHVTFQNPTNNIKPRNIPLRARERSFSSSQFLLLAKYVTSKKLIFQTVLPEFKMMFVNSQIWDLRNMINEIKVIRIWLNLVLLNLFVLFKITYLI